MAKLASSSSVLALILVAASLYVIEAKQFGIGIGRPKQREFDYYNLALQWPGTYCKRTQYCCPNNACCRGSNSPTVFTIHGLWPDYNDGSWPACCTRKTFDEKEICISTLLDPLEKYWPSLSCEKHGTCSAPVTGDEYNYFLTTLNVYFKYNVTAVLNEAGYVPSNTEKYPLGGIVSAIQNAFHATPKLVCRNGAVEELHLCFYKDFKPRDCAGASSSLNDMLYSSSSCPNYISIPAYASLGEGNVESEVSWVPEDVL
ncbi:hypothetical protein ACLB2K_020012 [Fragaria x ananassa]